MKLKNILEALPPHQEQDAVRITHDGPDAIRDTTNPSRHKDLKLSDTWKSLRDDFLDQYPEAKAMFAKGGEKREYQIRFKNVMKDTPDDLKSESMENLVKIIRIGLSIPNAVSDFNEISEAIHTGKLPGGEIVAALPLIISNPVVLKTTSGAIPKVVENYKKGIIIIPKIVGLGVEKSIKLVTLSIGKMLKMSNAPSQLITKFETDPFRVGKDREFDLIVTGHPIDIYGASTGRGWTSCANLNSPVNNKSEMIDTETDGEIGDRYGFEPDNAAAHIGHDIHEHVHMAYLVPSGGDIDTDAVARVSFKPHHKLGGSKIALISENRVYGNAPNGFLKVANEIVGKIFKIEDGMYIQSKNTYIDDCSFKSHGEASFNKNVFSEISQHFNELDDEDERESFIRTISEHINELNEHDYRLALTILTDKFINVLDNLTDRHDLSDSDGLYNFANDIITLDFFEDISNFESFADHIFAYIYHSDIFRRWWYNSAPFKNAMEDLLDGILEVMTFDSRGNSNVDHVMQLFDNLHNKEISKNKLSGSGRVDDLMRKLIYIHSFHHVFSDMFDWGNFAVREGTAFDNASAVVNEYFEGLKNTHPYLHDHILPELSSGISLLLKHFTNIENSTLDWLVMLEEHAGDEHVSDFEDLHTYKDWICYFISEELPRITTFEDGVLKLDPDTELSAKSVVKYLSSNCSKTTTVTRCIDIIQSDQDLSKLI